MFPGGRYWIGDIAYVMNPETHDFWENECGFGDGIFEFGGHTFGCRSTTVGDGDFRSNIDKTFSVDAGIIGVIPVALTDPSMEDEFTYGHFVDVARELKFSFDPEGNKFVFVCDDDSVIEIYVDNDDDSN